MALTPSTMIPLGALAPDFRLPDVLSGKTLALDDLKSGQATVIMFICNHCPYVKHVQEQLVKLARDYQSKGVAFIAINANDAANYPDDSPARMKETAQRLGYLFPYLFDETQATARAYSAACTPDFFVFDRAMKCAYRGQLDDSRPGNGLPVTGRDLRAALDQLLAGKAVDPAQKPSMGCNIKWKS